MPTVKTAELTGEALNWATAKAAGKAVQVLPAQYGIAARVFIETPSGMVRYRPTIDWATAGPLVDSLNILVCPPCDGDHWEASVEGCSDMLFGPIATVAICRAVVAAKLGDQVDVPEDLL